MTSPDQLATKLKDLDLNSIEIDDLNNSSHVPRLISALFESSDDDLFKKLISSPTDTKFISQLRFELRSSGNTALVVDRLQKIEDPTLTTQLLRIATNQDDVLANLLQANRKSLQASPTLFQIKLLHSIITHHAVINKHYFTNLGLALSQFNKSEEYESIILLVIVKLNEIDSSQLEITVLEHLDDLLDNEDTASLVLLFDTLTALLPLLPYVSNFINTNTRFKDTAANTEISDPSDSRVLPILKFLSAASLDDRFRSSVIVPRYYAVLTHSLDGLRAVEIELEKKASVVKVWLSLVVTKLRHYSKEKYDIETLQKNLTEALVDGVEQDCCVEGLVYLSLDLSVKKHIRGDVAVVEKLVKLLTDPALRTGVVVFAVLNVLTNITTYPDDDAQKAFGSKIMLPQKQGPQDDPLEIDKFLQRLLDLDFIGKASIAHWIESVNMKQQFVRLVANFTHTKAHRRQIVAQGVVKFILDYLTLTSSNLQYDPATLRITTDAKEIAYPDTRLIAIKTLARLLINTDPNLVFGKNFSATTCIPFLTEIFDNDTDAVQDKDVFEVLIALVNLSSLNDIVVKNLIVKTAFDTLLQTLALSRNTQIARTAIEVVANLSLSPMAIVKFFDFEQLEARRNFEIMLNLLDAIDIGVQIATLNFFANVTEFEPVSAVLAEEVKFRDLVMDFFQNEEFLSSDEFTVRLVYILLNLVSSVQSKEPQLMVFRNNELKVGLLKLLESAQDEEILQMCVSVCNIIDFTK